MEDEKMTELDKLIEAVEAGNVRNGVSGLKAFEDMARAFLDLPSSNAAFRAYHGSLDAAHALHEVLLPGCGWKTQKLLCNDHYTAEVWGEYAYSEESGSAQNPARAWLLAILRAYRSMQA